MILDLVSAHGVDLKSNEKVLHYSHNIHATTAPVGIYCRNNFYCSLQGIQLNETNGYFSSSISCKETSSTLKLSSSDEASRSGLAWYFFLVLWLKYMIYSAVGSDCLVLQGNQEHCQKSVISGSQWDPLANNSKRGNLFLVKRILFADM